jgi:hypothetical protein
MSLEQPSEDTLKVILSGHRKLGSETVNFFQSAGEMLEFIGDAVIAFQRLLRGKAQYRRCPHTPLFGPGRRVTNVRVHR